MKYKVQKIASALFILIGLALIILPQCVLMYNAQQCASMIETYNESLREVTPKPSIDQQLLKAEEYNNRLFLGEKTTAVEYRKLLAEDGTQMMGYVEIPSLNLLVPIFHDDSNALGQGAVHVLGTSLPVGGMNTHSVIAAHTGNQNGRFFTDIINLKEGDKFCITTFNRKNEYVVDRIKIVKPEEVKWLKIKKGHDYCTLLTCTPYGVNSHRLLVRGTRQKDEESVDSSSVADGNPVISDENNTYFYNYELMGSAILVATLVLYGFWGRKRGKQND